MKPPISSFELEYMRLKPKDRKDAIAYVRHRVRQLKTTVAEAEKSKIFKFGLDFLYGRQVEAEQILEFIKHIDKKDK